MDLSIPPILIPTLRELVHELVVGNIGALERDGRIGRLTGVQVRQALTDYGLTLTEITDQAIATSAAYALMGVDHMWHIDLTLCTLEEGLSDLTLSLTAGVQEDVVRVRLDDLHVL